jgi:hypothetical protein
MAEVRREVRTLEREAITSFVQVVVDGDVNALPRAVAQVDVNFVWKPSLRSLLRRGIAGASTAKRIEPPTLMPFRRRRSAMNSRSRSVCNPVAQMIASAGSEELRRHFLDTYSARGD